MKVKKNGKVVATHSACTLTREPKYCCTGKYNTPDKCKSDYFPHELYSDMKKICPTAYFYAYDDKTSTFRCQGKGRKSADYQVTFCG